MAFLKSAINSTKIFLERHPLLNSTIVSGGAFAWGDYISQIFLEKGWLNFLNEEEEKSQEE
jgi:hypothetical protein